MYTVNHIFLVPLWCTGHQRVLAKHLVNSVGKTVILHKYICLFCHWLQLIKWCVPLPAALIRFSRKPDYFNIKVLVATLPTFISAELRQHKRGYRTTHVTCNCAPVARSDKRKIWKVDQRFNAFCAPICNNLLNKCVNGCTLQSKNCY